MKYGRRSGLASYPPAPAEFWQIDDRERVDQFTFLEAGDDINYLWEYPTKVWESSKGTPIYSVYPAYDFIKNFQIEPHVMSSNPSRWRYKVKAMDYAARVLGDLIPEHWIPLVGFVPIPPSKTKENLAYDGRILNTLRRVRPRLKVCELVVQAVDCDAKIKGLTPADRIAMMELSEEGFDPAPDFVCIVDDLVTTGCHYKAVEHYVRQAYPDASIFGLFLTKAKRPPKDDDEALEVCF